MQGGAVEVQCRNNYRMSEVRYIGRTNISKSYIK